MCIAKRKDWQSRSCCSRISCHPHLHYLPSEHQLYSFLQRIRLIPQFPVCLFYTQPAETGTWCLFVHFLRGDGTDERAIQPQYVRYPISDVCNGQALAATEMIDTVLRMTYQLLHSLRHAPTKVAYAIGRTRRTLPHCSLICLPPVEAHCHAVRAGRHRTPPLRARWHNPCKRQRYVSHLPVWCSRNN